MGPAGVLAAPDVTLSEAWALNRLGKINNSTDAGSVERSYVQRMDIDRVEILGVLTPLQAGLSGPIVEGDRPAKSGMSLMPSRAS